MEQAGKIGGNFEKYFDWTAAAEFDEVFSPEFFEERYKSGITFKIAEVSNEETGESYKKLVEISEVSDFKST